MYNDYNILWARTPMALIAMVKAAMDNGGWQPIGGAGYCLDPKAAYEQNESNYIQGDMVVYQTMVSYRQE